jgi:Flp pilus assembly pilin Flp
MDWRHLRERRQRDDRGQAFGEYALLVAGLAIACVLAVLFLSGAIAGLFGSTSKPVQSPGVFQPPVRTPGLTWPTSLEECKDGGWRAYAQFADEKACTKYVESLTP